MIFRLACFVSGHGFGHAARVVAVLEALRQRSPEVFIEIFTSAPEFIFAQSLQKYRYHFLPADVGPVWKDAFTLDLAATLDQLERFLHFDPATVETLARQIDTCQAVLCDISPLGLAVAKKAKIPSVLLEQFTWDWLYSHYLAEFPLFAQPIETLAALYSRVTWHIQVEPICRQSQAVLRCAPIARRPRGGAQALRERLLRPGQKLVAVSLPAPIINAMSWSAISAHADCHVAIVGQDATEASDDHISRFGPELYRPDLIAAADVTLCGPSASTLAECAQAGCPTLLVTGAGLPEEQAAREYARQHLGGDECAPHSLLNGDWCSALPALFAGPRPQPSAANGGLAVASFLAGL
ncbi:MAG: hypothetical protein LBU39_03175 [Desulfobulbaceae bacterium]|nr:hypothetical protein [Desulfobulbaceae bacterium]